MIRFLNALVIVVALGSCTAEGPNSTKVSKPVEVTPAESDAALVELYLGQRVILTGPSIPIHPDYRDATTVAVYDEDVLVLAEEARDAQGYGSARQRFTFATCAIGSTDVRLEVRGSNSPVARAAVYHLNVRE